MFVILGCYIHALTIGSSDIMLKGVQVLPYSWEIVQNRYRAAEW